MQVKTLLEVGQVADALTVSTDTVDRLRRAGALRAVRVSARRWAYHEDDITEYIEANRM